MKSLRFIVSRDIKEFRKKRKLTQEKLADLASVDYKYLQRIEGKNPPNLRLATIERLAKALKVKPSKLLDY